jgi:hypothetical protein
MNAFYEGMDALVPKQVRGMVDKFKDDMTVYVTSNLDKFENENTITQFLSDLNLPFCIESTNGNGDIPESLWMKLNSIQVKGGTSFIFGQFANLEEKNKQIGERLKEILKNLNSEEEEDNECRKTHGNKWMRAPSNTLNTSFKQTIIEYTSNSFSIY